MIMVSYNLIQYNGIKYFGGDGFKFFDELEYEIEQFLDVEEDIFLWLSDDGLGMVEDYCEGVLKYIFFLEQIILIDLDGLKVVIDGVNGVMLLFIVNFFVDVNVDFILLYVLLNGLNINFNCGFIYLVDF